MSRATSRVLRAVPLLGALAVAACEPARPNASGFAELSARVDSLLATDRLEEAVVRLRAVSERRSGSGSAAWIPTWARGRATAIERMLALPTAARAELAAVARPVPASVPEDPDGWEWLRPALERQLEVRRRLLGSDAPEVAETMTALARVERRKGEPERALELNLEALRIRRRAFGAVSPEIAHSYLMIGRDHKLAGRDTGKPEAYLDSALALARTIYGRGSREYADILYESANVARWKERPDEALARFERVLAIRRGLDGGRSVGVARVLTDMAVTLLSRAEWPEIERLSGEAVAILDALRTGPTEEYALSLNMHGLALRHVGRLAEAERELERTIAVQEARRGAAPDEDLVRTRLHLLAGYGDLAAVQVLLGDTLGAWYSLERGTSRRWLEHAWRRGWVDSARTWDGLLERLQARLSDSSAVVGWLDPIFQPGTAGNPFWGYVVRRSGGVRWIAMEVEPGDPRRSFRAVGSDLSRRLDLAASWPYKPTRWAEIERDQRDLWGLRFAALEPWLDGVRELIVISPQVNYLAPVELMIDDRGRTLADRFAISYAPSALYFVTAPDPARQARVESRWKGLLVHAPGQFGPAGSGSELSAAKREIERVARRLDSPRVMVGPEASEASMRRLASGDELRRMDMVHFAAHGSASRSSGREIWLALAEAAGPSAPTGLPRDRDGLLTLADLGAWRLDARLVTLASCQSAGSWQAHSQGAIGLGQVMIQAGARSVVMSIWAVEDEAASLFMEHFYSALFERRNPPCSIAEAMREARLKLRDHRAAGGARVYAHPMHWAGFVLLGDPG